MGAVQLTVREVAASVGNTGVPGALGAVKVVPTAEAVPSPPPFDATTRYQ